MMRKDRCPVCGQKSFSATDRIYIGHLNLATVRPDRGNNLDGCRCTKCSKHVMLCKESTVLHALFYPHRIGYGLPLIPALVTALYSLGAVHWIFIALAALYYLAFVVYGLIYSLTRPLVPYLLRDGEYVPSKPHMRVKVNSSKYIKPRFVYGLQFKGETVDEHFSENFPDRMLAAQLLPTDNGLVWEACIFNRSEVPKDLAVEGAKFLLEDADGIFIAKGTVQSIETNY